ncbi:nucleotide kinase domain-containing protein [Prevotella histicola]|uniref:nucleotide kinase domain-containing protein n=1 Tax=Prevotella histicola TaxID=470565 RepID=UPI0028E9646B|nr:nucleotide kinase domain-containing protein [Prevotella histicola]
MKTKEIIPNHQILCYYFYFMQERMKMFWKKCDSKNQGEYTRDNILGTYKFTNVYRACDRISQYLIEKVIYKDIEKYTPEDTLLRILIFKIFNKIETWEYIQDELESEITIESFNVHKISTLLSVRQKYTPIFNNAYMMAGSHKKYDYLRTKHEKWLTMVEKEFIQTGLFNTILKAVSLEEVYRILTNCSFIGNFIAYQYAIDFNYCPYLNFSENSFVKAGIGAIRGIKKCFYSYGSKYEDAIYYIQEHLDKLRKMYGYNDFKPLPGHEPTLIDLQNCFCETDKYLRAKIPELKVGNVRIKQKYKESPFPIYFNFPPKWGINTNNLCTKPNIRE